VRELQLSEAICRASARSAAQQILWREIARQGRRTLKSVMAGLDPAIHLEKRFCEA
jgi:hypothetical protein